MNLSDMISKYPRTTLLGLLSVNDLYGVKNEALECRYTAGTGLMMLGCLGSKPRHRAASSSGDEVKVFVEL